MIDDDETLVAASRATFEAAGFTFMFAPDGKVGVTLAKNSPPSLIILDVMMPSENGIMGLKELKRHERTKDIPILVYTNLEKAYSLVRGQGIADFVLKFQTTPEELVRRIVKILEQKGGERT